MIVEQYITVEAGSVGESRISLFLEATVWMKKKEERLFLDLHHLTMHAIPTVQGNCCTAHLVCVQTF